MTSTLRHHRQNTHSSGNLEIIATPQRSSSSNSRINEGKEGNKLGRKDSDLKKSQNSSSYNMNRVKFFVLMVLCLQNTLFTVMRRYSLGVLKEKYSKVRNDY
jgi:hypothetical protein